jgi:hypothetical protein
MTQPYIEIAPHAKFWFFPDSGPQPVDMPAIAQALSRKVRFGGFGKYEISVAEHSINVADMMNPPYQIYGLLHDAAEAIVGDMVKPLKDLMPAFKLVENQIQEHILRELGLWPVPDRVQELVDYCDLFTLGLEAERQFGRYTWDEWVALRPVRDVLPGQQLAIPPGTLPRSAMAKIFLDHFTGYLQIYLDRKGQ